MRTSISLALIAFASVGFAGDAAAQYYPPPYPNGVYAPPPPPPSPYGRRYYQAAPLPPIADDAAPADPSGAPAPYGHAPYVERQDYGRPPGSYDPRYNRQAMPGPAYPDPNGAARRPYYVPDASEATYGPDPSQAPQSLPAFGGDPIPRPPADVGAPGAPPDVTGSIRGPAGNPSTVVAALPPEDQPEQGPRKELPPQFRRHLVDYVTREPAGTLVIDTPNTYLYLVLGNGKAMRYGIGVGREGFTWAGAERISRMSEWPDWHPPKEMIERQPYLPRFMAGGDGNPLGARALYLGNTLYRIHGTNQPSTIGTFVSSGCIRLTNEDLYGRVNVGTRVVVMPGSGAATASARTPAAR